MAAAKVSVIVPVYNAKPYIRQCIESIINQTLKEIEIVIINDGSTDGSEQIIEEFIEVDERIILLDGTNEGVSAARNKGVSIASGEFIGFVDADDWVQPEMYDVLYQKAVEANADISICNVNLAEGTSNINVRLRLENNLIDISGKREVELINMMRFKYDHANWNKIYSNPIIKRNNLSFNQQMTVGEDLLFNLCFFQFAKMGVVIDACLYNYRVHPLSVMNKNSHDKVAEYSLLFKNFCDFLTDGERTGLIETFSIEMRRGFYHTIVPKVFNDIKSKHLSFFKTVRLFANELKKANKGIFSFSRSELKGVQGYKKWLLTNNSYLLFSLIVAIGGLKNSKWRL